jgi:hypothetical protein
MKTNDLQNPEKMFNYNATTGEVRWNNTGKVAGYINDRGYRVIELSGKRFKAHRIAWTLFHGKPPVGEIDHINRQKSDNRIDNLRDTNTKGNMQNRGLQKNNTSGHRGVVWHKRDAQWRARIKVNNIQHHLGAFDKFEDAVTARQVAEDVFEFLEDKIQNKTTPICKK